MVLGRAAEVQVVATRRRSRARNPGLATRIEYINPVNTRRSAYLQSSVVKVDPRSMLLHHLHQWRLWIRDIYLHPVLLRQRRRNLVGSLRPAVYPDLLQRHAVESRDDGHDIAASCHVHFCHFWIRGFSVQAGVGVFSRQWSAIVTIFQTRRFCFSLPSQYGTSLIRCLSG